MTITTPFRITICGIDELSGHGAVGVTHVLSILDPHWPIPEAFGSFEEHERCELRFHDVIEDGPGMVPPRDVDVARLLAFGKDILAEPAPNAHLLVHCHAGVSRSTASMILMVAQAQPERAAVSIASEILRIRPQAWPNLRIVELGDVQLGRDGQLVGAAVEIYRQRLAERPELAQSMTECGRGREVAVARNAA